VPVEYRRPGDARWNAAVTSNLSYTGALLESTPTTLHVGDELELRLTAPPALTGDASVPVLCMARVVRTETGARERIAAAILNIWLEERTAAARNARAELVKDLCHQINNSLTSIAGRADLLIVGTSDDTALAQLRAIRDAALGAALPLRQLHDIG
jgi:signal transduction histidine kinase